MSITSQVAKSGPFLISSNGQVVPVGFPFNAASDLLVLDTGPTASSYDPAKVLVLGSDYTVTGGSYNSANQLQTGSITISTSGQLPVAVNDYIVIMRNVPINQTQSFTATGPATIELLEQGLDKQATISQELEENISRCLQFEDQEFLSGIMSLTARENMLLGFSPTGAVQFYPPSSAVFTTGSFTGCASIAALKALSVSGLTTGAQAYVSGYYSVGDGGGGTYVYNSSSSATDNGGTRIAPSSGSGRWLLVYFGVLSVKQFGCYGDNTHADATAFQAAVTAAAGMTLMIPQGQYLIGSTIALPQSLRIVGTSRRGEGSPPSALGACLVATFAGPVLSRNPGSLTSADIELEHFQIVGNEATYGAGDGVYVNNTSDFFMHNMVISEFGTYGVHITQGCSSCYLKDIYSAQNTTANFFIGAEYSVLDNCTSDGSTYSVYVGNGGDGTRIVNCTLEGSSSATVYVVSGATSVDVSHCNLNLTAGGYGVQTLANRTRIVDNKIFANATSGYGILLGSSSFENIVTGNDIEVDLTAVEDDGSGLNTISGNLISGGGTGLKINDTTYYDQVTGNFIQGATNSVLHAGGYANYSGNTYQDESGNYKAPNVTGGTATGIPFTGTFALSSGVASITQANVAATAEIDITLKTVSGAVTGLPYVSTITVGTGFTVAGGGSGNNSTYNYKLTN